MHAYRIGHTATLLLDGTVLVVGLGTGAARVRAELDNPSTGRLTYTASPAKTRGLTATFLRLLDGRVLATGDYSDRSRGRRARPTTGRALTGSAARARPPRQEN